MPAGITSRRIAASAGYLLNSRGQREKLTREDGTTWNFGYNDRSEVISGNKKLSNGSLAAGLQFSYRYDAIGNRKWAKSGGDANGANFRTTQYTPNALNQYSEIINPGSFDVLVRSAEPVRVLADGLPVAMQTQGSFHRAEVSVGNTDGAWVDTNVTSPIGQNPVSGKRWVPPATVNPIYDADGNLERDGRWTYTWDAENRLVSMTTNSGAGFPAAVPRIKLEFAYDFLSRRIQKKVINLVTSDVISDERFVYQGWNVIALFNATGTTLSASPKQTNLWGLDLSGTLQGAGGVAGLLSVSSISDPLSPISYPSYDGNGNIIAWTDTSGAIKQRIDYDPFGNIVTREGVPGFEAPAWGFSTKYQDKETGLLYYGFRFYDPVNGRWLSRDPIEEEGGLNLHGFVGNDGVNWIDFLGLADINVEIIRQYLEWETIGTFTAIPTDDEAKKCCGSVTGQTLELKKGNYEVVDGRGNKNYPIYEAVRDGVYSSSSNTSINGQQRWLDNNYPNSNGAPRALVPGTIGENNINVISNNPRNSGQSSFGGTRMHHGQSSQSSEGCPIVGCNMKKGDISNSRYSDAEKGKKFPGHYFDKRDSIAKAIELNTLVECVQKSLKRKPTIKVNIRSK